MIRLFLENRVWTLLLLPVFIGVFTFLNQLTGFYPISTHINLGLWGTAPMDYVLSAGLSFGLILINAVALNIIFNLHEFMDKNSYIVSLLYVVTMSFYHSFYSFDGSLIAHSMIILMLLQFLNLKQNVDGRKEVFNGSFFAGVAATFFPPLILAYLPILFMTLIIRPFIIREMVLSFFGFLTPLLYAGTFLWYNNVNVDWKILEDINNNRFQIDFITNMVFLGILLGLGTISLSARLQKASIRLKKQIQMLWVIILLSIAFGVWDFILYKQIERFSLLMIPLSYLLSYSFLHKRYAIVANVVFYLTILYALLKFFIFQPSAST